MDILQLLGFAIKEGSPYLMKFATEHAKAAELDKTRRIHEDGFKKMRQVVVQEGYGRLQEGGGSDCPTCRIDSLVRAAGNRTWNLLHSTADAYPVEPDAITRQRVRSFLESILFNFPCRECADDMVSFVRENPIDYTSRDSLRRSVCEIHNHVNAKLDKRLLKC